MTTTIRTTHDDDQVHLIVTRAMALDIATGLDRLRRDQGRMMLAGDIRARLDPADPPPDDDDAPLPGLGGDW